MASAAAVGIAGGSSMQFTGEVTNWNTFLRYGKTIRITYSHRDPTIHKSGTDNIFIKNLDKAIDNKALLDAFSAFGNILSCKIATDGKGNSKGYGFVQFENEDSAENAIDKLNGMLIDDKQVYVGQFLCKQGRESAVNKTKFNNVYVKNLSEATTDEDLRNITGAVVMRDGDGRSRCFGFINYENADDAARAVETLNGKKLDDKEWYVGRAQKKSERELELKGKFEQSMKEAVDKYQGANLYIKNLDDTIDDDKLLQIDLVKRRSGLSRPAFLRAFFPKVSSISTPLKGTVHRRFLDSVLGRNLWRKEEARKMGLPAQPVATTTMDTLSEKAALMRESLQKSQTITDNILSILGSFDHRLSALETAMRPTQIRTHSIRKAHENIDKTLKASEVILVQFDLTRQAEAKILKGPHEDLESYLEAIDQLRSNERFFNNYKNFRNSEVVVNHTKSLVTKAVSKLEEEFNQLLSLYSKPVEPDHLFECLPNSLRPSSGDQVDSSGKNHGDYEQQNRSSENAVYTPPILIPPRILPLLHNLAKQMFQAWHHQQLLKIYRDTRSSVLEESLRKLGVEKLSKDDVQKMQWEVLEAKIGNWIHFMRIAVKLLFAGREKFVIRYLKASILSGISVLLK
ncbi:hypothetical protein Nepgr_015098 [Nepenthes gracilis]|uniref:RRM domain-containing protein n=1 Tax=Nepenthes gracilis TaxID=150966 RepID=A0AAD3XQ46_NEPGR|nr:hypothetical protein Nepgr_015098 [Nepenthes gracilis]